MALRVAGDAEVEAELGLEGWAAITGESEAARTGNGVDDSRTQIDLAHMGGLIEEECSWTVGDAGGGYQLGAAGRTGVPLAPVSSPGDGRDGRALLFEVQNSVVQHIGDECAPVFIARQVPRSEVGLQGRSRAAAVDSAAGDCANHT